MLLVYCEKITPRVRYAVDLLIRQVLQGSFELTSNPDTFSAAEGAKLNYSSNQNLNGILMQPAALLFESGIKAQQAEVVEHQGQKVLFPVSEDSILPYDAFAAAFFMATRYEEYLPHQSDQHQRFSASDSLAHKNGFLQIPIVHHWANHLKAALLVHFPTLEFQKHTYQFINTLDIDNAFAYRQKGVARTMGALGRSLFKGQFGAFKRRLKVLFGKEKDPYDTFDYILETHKKHQLNSIVFFLLADYGLNDKNVPVSSRVFRSLIKYTADYTQVGIHPSYGSNTKPEKLEVEIDRLATITKRPVSKSRQHFLMLSFPETYRRLIDLGITDDYTMGFASETGFRSGMCIPYQHYDLDAESLTILRIHPFAAMDGTLNEYLHLSPEQAIARVKALNEAVREVGGTFISLWHNETLNDEGKWKGWRAVYESTIETAKA